MTKNTPIVHQKNLAIAWGDMDALGHVNNVRYLDYFQEARIEWLQELNISMQEATGPVVVHVACTYFKPLVYPAIVRIDSVIQHLGHSSITIEHNVYQNDVLMAQGISKVVWINYQEGKSTALPHILRTLYEQQQANS